MQSYNINVLLLQKVNLFVEFAKHYENLFSQIHIIIHITNRNEIIIIINIKIII